MAWIGIGVVIFFIGILGLGIGFDSSNEGFLCLGILGLILGAFIMLGNGICASTNMTEQKNFIEYQYIIENYPTSAQAEEIDIIAANTWLINAQYDRKIKDNFSLYNKSILDLAPIETPALSIEVVPVPIPTP